MEQSNMFDIVSFRPLILESATVSSLSFSVKSEENVLNSVEQTSQMPYIVVCTRENI